MSSVHHNSMSMAKKKKLDEKKSGNKSSGSVILTDNHLEFIRRCKASHIVETTELNVNFDRKKFLKLLAANNRLLICEINKKFFYKIKNKLNPENVPLLFQIAKYFACTNLAKLSFSYIERNFGLVCKTNNFLNMEVDILKRIIASSELNVTSETEIIKAADAFVKHNQNVDTEKAEQILSKIRLHLLSDPELESLANMDFTFCKANNWNEKVSKVKEIKSSFDYSGELTLRRFCSQNNFDIFFSGGFKRGVLKRQKILKNDFKKFNINNFKEFTRLPEMSFSQYSHKSLYCNGNIYLLGGIGCNNFSGEPWKTGKIFCLRKFCLANESWETVTEYMEWSSGMCVCSYVDDIYMIGGKDSGIIYDTKAKKFKSLADLKQPRRKAACTVFQGKIVVCGGEDEEGEPTNTVQCFDSSGQWELMSSLVEQRVGHCITASRNKIFVIGGRDGIDNELFDYRVKQFVLLKAKVPTFFQFRFSNILHTFCIGDKIIVIGEKSETIIYYDIENKNWCEKDFKLSIDEQFSCTVVPQMI